MGDDQNNNEEINRSFISDRMHDDPATGRDEIYFISIVVPIRGARRLPHRVQRQLVSSPSSANHAKCKCVGRRPDANLLTCLPPPRRYLK